MIYGLNRFDSVGKFTYFVRLSLKFVIIAIVYRSRLYHVSQVVVIVQCFNMQLWVKLVACYGFGLINLRISFKWESNCIHRNHPSDFMEVSRKLELTLISSSNNRRSAWGSRTGNRFCTSYRVGNVCSMRGTIGRRSWTTCRC